MSANFTGRLAGASEGALNLARAMVTEWASNSDVPGLSREKKIETAMNLLDRGLIHFQATEPDSDGNFSYRLVVSGAPNA